VAVSVVGAVLGVGGAGHAYLRRWGRALAWFVVVLGVGATLIVAFADPRAARVATLPVHVTGPILVLLTLNTADTYYVARRDAGEDGGDTCPSCGRSLDPELSFCPWCAGSREVES
jgi:hypothetical protein